jgi:ATP-dependent protease ClpP protease subunit
MRLLLFTIALALCLFSAGNASAKEVVLTQDNTLVLNSAFSGKSVSELIGQAKKMDADLKSGYPIYLFLDTPGGGIQAGLELIEFLRGLNRPVHTVTLFAASMGWQLLQHLGTRYVLQYGVLMSHKAYGGFRGEFGGGESQLDSRYGLWLRRLNTMDKQTVKRTNGKKTLKQYQSEYDNELWLNGGEAVSNGYADEVATVKCDKGLKGTRSKTIRFLGFKIEVVYDKCPIRTYPIDIKATLRTNKGYMDLDEFMEKGGKFGKNCIGRDIPPERSWDGKHTTKGIKAELCLIDKELTLDEIEDKIREERDRMKNRKKNIVRMSFGNFISEL